MRIRRYPFAMRKMLLALAMATLSGCASQHAQVKVAVLDSTPRPATKKVAYYDDESQAPRPYTVIAIVSVPGDADVQSGAVAEVLGKALDEARKLGGEAIILHRTGPSGAGGNAEQTLYKVIVSGQTTRPEGNMKK